MGERDDQPPIQELADELLRAVDQVTGPAGPVVLLYSGGIDSSLLGWCLRSRAPRLFCIGLPGAPDLDSAAVGATTMDLPLTAVEVTESEIHSTWQRWRAALARLREPDLSVALTELLAFERAPPGRLVTGQGADELFHGYAHFRGLGALEAADRAAADLARLTDVDWPRTVGFATRLQREVVAPYLAPGFVRAVRLYPGTHEASPDRPTKPVLREIARQLGLPRSLIDRPKRAMQYGSRVAHVVRKLGLNSPSSSAAP